jgi:hypothetical protein
MAALDEMMRIIGDDDACGSWHGKKVITRGGKGQKINPSLFYPRPDILSGLPLNVFALQLRAKHLSS